MDRILLWNVRGVNKQSKHRDIKHLISQTGAGFVSLLETKVRNKDMGKLYENLFSGWCFTSNNPWRDRGRIILAWNPTIFTVDIQNCTDQLIHCLVQLRSREWCFITCVYGCNTEKERKELWSDLEKIAGVVTRSWLVIGNFNNILEYGERIGRRAHKHISWDFKECVNVCGLEDIKASGSFFTWSNKQDAENRIYSKIDRALVNEKWVMEFHNSEASFLPEGQFDHCPILVSFYREEVKRARPFKYYKMWQEAPSFHDMVRSVWQGQVTGVPMYIVVSKLKKLKVLLRRINKELFGDVKLAAIRSKQDLESIQQGLWADPMNEELINQERRCREKYMFCYKAYSTFLA